MPERLHALAALLRGQTSAWLHSPRTVIMGIIILLMTISNALSLQSVLESDSLYAYFGETSYVFLASGFGNIVTTSAFFLIMVSEIPRRIAFQNMMLIRCNRKKWLNSQILFCVYIVALMLVLMFVLSMVLSMPYLSQGNGWSDLERIASDPEAINRAQLVSSFIRVIPPWQAVMISIPVLFAFWFTMVLIILMFSLRGRPNLGLMVYASLLVLDITVMWENLPPALRYFPTNFATSLRIAAAFPDHEMQAIGIAIIVYIVVDILLIGMMQLRVKGMDIQFSGKDEK